MLKKLAKEFTEAFGTPGFEEDVLDLIDKYKEDLILEKDGMNNAWLITKNHDKSKPNIMLDAHTDEVGFMVQFIHDNGLISFIPTGGWIPSNIPAHIVRIKGSKGFVKGITSSMPPHFMTQAMKDAPLDIKNMHIDIGAFSRQEVLDKGIDIGSPIAPEVKFEELDNGLYRGKAFDNRMGCVSVLYTMLKFKDKILPFNLVGSFSSQEEVGLRGASVNSSRIKPYLAVVFEGSPSDDRYYSNHQAQCVIGEGVQIRCFDSKYISNRRLIDFATSIADKNNLDYQLAVRSSGATNSGVIHLSENAPPVLVLAVPSRYIHSHYNYASSYDLKSTVDFAEVFINSLDEKELNNLCFDSIKNSL